MVALRIVFCRAHSVYFSNSIVALLVHAMYAVVTSAYRIRASDGLHAYSYGAAPMPSWSTPVCGKEVSVTSDQQPSRQHTRFLIARTLPSARACVH